MINNERGHMEMRKEVILKYIRKIKRMEDYQRERDRQTDRQREREVKKK